MMNRNAIHISCRDGATLVPYFLDWLNFRPISRCREGSFPFLISWYRKQYLHGITSIMMSAFQFSWWDLCIHKFSKLSRRKQKKTCRASLIFSVSTLYEHIISFQIHRSQHDSETVTTVILRYENPLSLPPHPGGVCLVVALAGCASFSKREKWGSGWPSGYARL